MFVNIRGLPGAHYWYRQNYTRTRKKIKLPCEQLWLCRETTLNVMLKNILLRWVFNKSVLFWRQILWNFPIVFYLLGNTPFPTLPLLPSMDEKKIKILYKFSYSFILTSCKIGHSVILNWDNLQHIPMNNKVTGFMNLVSFWCKQSQISKPYVL